MEMYPGTIFFQIVLLIMVVAILGVGILLYRSRKK